MEWVGFIKVYTTLTNKTALGQNFFAMILCNPISLLELDAITDMIKKVKNV